MVLQKQKGRGSMNIQELGNSILQNIAVVVSPNVLAQESK